MQYIFAISGLINAIAAIFFSSLIVIKNKKGAVNKLCLSLTVATAFWSFFYWRWLLVYNDEQNALFFVRLLSIGSTFLPIIFFHWILTLLEIKRKKVLIFYYFLTFFYSLFFFSDLFIKGVEPKLAFSFWPVPGPIYDCYLITHYGVLLFYAFILLIKGYKKFSGIKKLQIRYVLLGSVLGFGGGATNFFLWYDISIPPFGNFFVVCYIFSFTYAIIQHRFMSIRLLMSKVYVTLIISICAYILFQAFIYLYFLFISLHLGQIQVITIEFFIAFIVAVLLIPFLNYIQKSSDYLFFRKGNPSTMIKNVSLKLSSAIDMKQLLFLLNAEFKKIIGTEFISIIYTTRKTSRRARKQELITFKKNVLKTVPIDKESSLINYLLKGRKVFVIDEINDSNSKSDMELLWELKRYNAHIIAPIESRGKIMGAIIFGPKMTRNAYTKEDIEFIEIVSFQAGTTIESAYLYQEIKNFNIHLKREIKKATTDLKAANKKLIIAYEKLHKLDRAKSEFLSIASHQLRTPLTSIKGFTSLLLEGSYGKISKEVKEVLEKIFLSNERLVQLVEDLLNISRIESGRFVLELKKNNISNLLKGIVDSFVISAKSKNISLKLILPKKKIRDFYFDSGKIQEVISNFIDNALKYSQSGTIAIEAKNMKDVVRIAVTDNGRGILNDELRYIFEKFQRGKDVNQIHTEGIGLGLYVCKVVIKAHKGKIWAESRGAGKGSTFLFELKKGLKPKDIK
ncbi:MAG: ATP-binding protein [Patescibacteria group bacterium]|nr:ATP-binding protein [Patescibacteria group bacterium]